MQSFRQIEHEIIQRLESLLKTPVAQSLSEREWTVEVKRTLGSLGKEKGYKVCGSIPDEDFEPEWLYDLLWYTYDSEQNLTNIQLILEMEWATEFDEIKWDFEKLITGRADQRVMIFQTNNENGFENFCRRLIKSIATFKHSCAGDRYLFIGYNNKTKSFMRRTHEY